MPGSARVAPRHDAGDPSAYPRDRSWVYWPFRVVTAAAAVLLFNQAVFAGQFLSGSYGSLHTHRENATFAGIAVIISALAAVPIRWPGRGPWWPLPASVALFGLIGVQMVLGFSRVLAVHIPLGVAIIALGVLLAVWAWRPHPCSAAPGTTAAAESTVSDPKLLSGKAPR